MYCEQYASVAVASSRGAGRAQEYSKMFVRQAVT